MATPVVVGTSGGGINGSGDFEVALPGSSFGYIAVAFWYGSVAQLTPPSGWTQLEKLSISGDAWGNSGIWFTNEATDETWNHGAGESAAVLVVGYSTQIEVEPWAAVTGGTDNAPVSPSVTTPEASLILRTLGNNYWSGNASLTSPVAYPAGTTNQAIQRNGPGGTGADHYMVAVAHSLQGAAGATGTATWGRGAGTYTMSWPRVSTISINSIASDPAFDDSAFDSSAFQTPPLTQVTKTVSTTWNTLSDIVDDRVLYDDFNRVSMTPGNAPSGQAWSVISGVWDVNGTTIGETNGADGGIAIINSGLSNCLVETKFHAVGGMEAGQLLFRSNSAGSSYYTLDMWTDGSLRLTRNLLDIQSSAAGAVANGDTVSAKVVEEGGSTRIYGYVNGVQLINYLDSTGGRPTGTYVGYRHASGNSGYITRNSHLQVKPATATPNVYDSSSARSFGQSYAQAVAARSVRPVRIAAVGDSILEGWGASVASARPIQKFLDLVRAEHGLTGGEGYIPAYYVHGQTWKSRWVRSGSFTENVAYGLGKRALVFSSAGNLTLTTTGTHMDLMWRGGGGTFSWRVDGGAATNVNTSGNGNDSGMEGRKTRISLGSAGSHTVTVTWVSGTVTFEGGIAYNGDTTSGFNILDATHSGWYSNEPGDHGFTTLAPHMNDYQPSLILFEMVGANNYIWNSTTPAANLTNVQTLINRYLNLPSQPDVLLVIPRITDPPSSGSNTWNQYMDLIAGITHSRIKLLDLRNNTGVTLADGVHPNDAGHAVQAQAMYDALAAPSTTPVTKSYAQTWNVNGQVAAKTYINTWNLRAFISKTYAQTWNVRSFLTKSYANSWTVLAALSKSYAQTWNIRSVVAKTSASTWAVTVSIPKSYGNTWGVSSLVTKSSASTWNVSAPISSVTKTSNNTWGIGGSVTKNSASTWNIRSSVIKSSAGTWNVRSSVAVKSYASTWTVRTTAIKSYAGTWNVRSALSKSYLSTWGIKTSLVKTYSNTWGINTSLVKSSANTWNIFSQVAKTYASSWNTFATATYYNLTDTIGGLTPPTATNDDGSVNLGTEFYVTSPAWVTQIRWWQPENGVITNHPATRTVGLFRVDSGSAGTMLAGPFSSVPSGTGWQSVTLPTALELAPNQRYRVVVLHPNGRYAATPTVFTPTTNYTGPLVVVPSATNTTGTDQGSFHYGSIFDFTVESFNNTYYWSDVVIADNDPTGGPTPVTKIVSSTWNIIGGVTKTNANTWSTKSSVTKSYAGTWNVRTTATASKSSTWNVRSAIAKTSQSTWNLQATVAPATNVNTWNVRSVVNKAAANSWAVREALSKASSSTWTVRSRVTTSKAGTWNILGLATKGYTSTWNARAFVTDTNQVLWNARTLVTKTSENLWDTAAIGSVSSTYENLWNVRTRVTVSKAQTWNIRTSLSTSKASTWNIRTRATKPYAQTWNLRALTTKTSITNWGVYLVVSKIASNAWSVRSPIGAVFDSNWAVRSLTTSEVPISWSTLQLVSDEFSISWDILAEATNVLSTQWSVAREITRGYSNTWIVREDNKWYVKTKDGLVRYDVVGVWDGTQVVPI